MASARKHSVSKGKTSFIAELPKLTGMHQNRDRQFPVFERLFYITPLLLRPSPSRQQGDLESPACQILSDIKQLYDSIALQPALSAIRKVRHSRYLPTSNISKIASTPHQQARSIFFAFGRYLQRIHFLCERGNAWRFRTNLTTRKTLMFRVHDPLVTSTRQVTHTFCCYVRDILY